VRPRQPDQPQIVLLGEYGHALSGPEWTPELKAQMEALSGDSSWRERPETKAELGPIGLRANNHPHIFPNMWITTPGWAQVSLRIPRGPLATEIWWFTFVDRSMDTDLRKKISSAPIHQFDQRACSSRKMAKTGARARGTVGTVAKPYPLNYAMNLGRGPDHRRRGGPPYIEARVNEHAQLWHYRSWADWMAADSWADLKANHTQVPSGAV